MLIDIKTITTQKTIYKFSQEEYDKFNKFKKWFDDIAYDIYEYSGVDAATDGTVEIVSAIEENLDYFEDIIKNNVVRED